MLAARFAVVRPAADGRVRDHGFPGGNWDDHPYGIVEIASGTGFASARVSCGTAAFTVSRCGDEGSARGAAPPPW